MLTNRPIMRTKQGTVTSDKMTDTIVVSVVSAKMHSKYLKRYNVSKKFHADTNGIEATEGDEVIIQECRPLSKTKCWKLIEVLNK